MAIHILRDFAAATSGYTGASAFFHISYLFGMAVFLNKILGYNIMGHTAFDLNNTNNHSFTASQNTAIAAASNGQSLPQTTINVISTATFPASGRIYVTTSAGIQIVNYSGTTATTFTNCSGGTGTMSSGSNTTIVSGSNGVILPQATINVEATATASTTIAAGSNGQTLPQATINVASTTGFPASGTLNVTTSAGVQTVTYTGKTATTFTGASGGTGTMSTGGAVNNTGFFVDFPTSGTIYVQTTAGVQTVTYTGRTATTFTGCTGGTGTMNTGNNVASAGVGGVACGQNKITAATGNPVVITLQFPHEMIDGQYVVINNNLSNSFYGFNNASLGNLGPYKVEVVSSTQLRLPWTIAQSFVANTASILPPGLLVASGTVAGGTGASINFGGAPSVYAVQVPTTIRTVVNGAAPNSGDTGRILVLKSSRYPTKNSGMFKITATNTATNSYTIDYRSSETPPPETMDWWLYEIETRMSEHLLLPNYNQTNGIGITAATNTTPIQISINSTSVSHFDTGHRVTISSVGGNTAANGTWTITRVGAFSFTLNGSSGNGNYTSGGTATRVGYTGGNNVSLNSKIILQSPHSSGWQVRIAGEPWNVTGTPAYSSVSTGYGGSVFGDFATNGTHTHMAQFLDFTSLSGTQYVNTLIGCANPSQPHRFTIIGDDTGQGVFLYTRTQTSGNNGMLLFGLPDNEPTPISPNINRPFVYGSNQSGDYGTIQTRWAVNFNVGFTFRDFVPEMCGLAGWVTADGVSGATSPVYSANAGDSPFTGTTEVLPWEIWGGIATDPSLNLPYPTAGTTIYGINQRLMGTAPFIRQGRTNFGTFTQSTENTASLTITNATNAAPIQVTTSVANSLTTGQTVTISGVNGNTNANGTFVITVINNQNFTLNGSSGNAAYTSGGTVNGTARWIHLQNGIYMAWNGATGLTP